MRERLKKRMRSAAGFTLTELLLAMLIMGLAGSVIVNTVQLAAGHFAKLRLESDAQLLCSALSLAVQDELMLASDIKEEGGAATFFSGSRMVNRKCAIEKDDNGIVCLVVKDGSNKKYELVPKAEYLGSAKRGIASSGGYALTVSDFSVGWDGTKFAVEITVTGTQIDVTTATAFSVIPIAPAGVKESS